jgi:hypothetical protein
MNLEVVYGSLWLHERQEHEITEHAEQQRRFYHPIEFLCELRRVTRINNDVE